MYWLVFVKRSKRRRAGFSAKQVKLFVVVVAPREHQSAPVASVARTATFISKRSVQAGT